MWWLMPAVLLLCSIYDIRGLTVPLWATGLCFCAAAVCLMQRGGFTIVDVILSLLPGVVFFFYSLAAGGKMGAGDALIIMAVGLGAGILPAITAICISFMLAAVFAAALVIIFKKGKSFRIPFVPFIAAGAGVAMWIM